MAFIRATGTHRRTRSKTRHKKAAGIAGLTVGVVGTLATPAMAGSSAQAKGGAAEKSVQETRDEAGSSATEAAGAQDGGISGAVGFGDSLADTVSDQARLQQQAAAEAKAANEAKRKAAAEKAAQKREAREKAERAERARERAKLNAYVAPVEGASLSTSYQSSGGLWSSGSHTGVDFEADEGTEVRSVAAGEVVEAGMDGSFGNSIVVKHRDGTYTQYGHLSSISVSAGQTVEAGQQIGLSGSTGNTTGPHLHFEARTSPEYGSDTDPVAYLGKHGVDL